MNGPRSKFHVTIEKMTFPRDGAPLAHLRVEQRGPLFYVHAVIEPLTEAEWMEGDAPRWANLADIITSVAGRAVERLRGEERPRG